MRDYKPEYKVGGIFANTDGYMRMNPNKQFEKVSRTFAMVSESDVVTSAVAVLDAKDDLIWELTEAEKGKVIVFAEAMTRHYERYMYSLNYANVLIITKVVRSDFPWPTWRRERSIWYARRLTWRHAKRFYSLPGIIDYFMSEIENGVHEGDRVRR